MSSLEEQLALFEKEVLSAVEANSSNAELDKNGFKSEGPIQAPDIGGSSSSSNSAGQPVPTKFVPHQLRVTSSHTNVHRPTPAGAPPIVATSVIESGPTLYAQPGTSKSATTNQKQMETGPAAISTLQPQSFRTLALPSDVELLAAKKQAVKAHENSYLGAVLRGEKKMKRFVRSCGGQVWEDPSMAEWDPSDFRIFCGDLGNEVSDELLAKAFRKYPSFQKAKVVRDSRTNKSKGFGFVSFKHQDDFIRAMKEMDGKYVGNRPIKLRKSNWKERNLDTVKKKNKEKKKLGLI